MTWQQTHETFNQFDELRGYDLYATDTALRDCVRAAGAGWAEEQLGAYGRAMGSEEMFEHAALANRHPPELQAFDARGRRIDFVEFHPSWHAVMAQARRGGLASLALRDALPGRWVANMAAFYLHCEVESGSTCPTIMTFAAIPLLRREPALWAQLGDKLLADDYDPRDLPIAQKRSIYIGMGMTEKQGGSDVRANTTAATPIGAGGRGGEYLIRGHKWFFSAPMCDAHLVVARTPEGGPSCFFVPRWKPDGSKNAVRVQRLKDKLGNKSNSSSEVEFEDAWGIQIGEDGRGIPTIIEMAGYTRMACVVSSAAFVRQALVQALAYARRREAFGKVLAAQPLMRNVLADLALESEAALVLGMRIAAAFEREEDALERIWKRIVTPAAKFWVCKRALELTGEAMEVFGGNGYVENGTLARLYREAPVNSIWEGSGNVMCLDVMRAVARDPHGFLALLDRFAEQSGGDAAVLREIDGLRALLASPPEQLEGLGRLFAERLVLLTQAVLLRESSPGYVADAFVATRLGARWGHVVGAFDGRAIDIDRLLERALPAG